jgi:hypothetical protein
MLLLLLLLLLPPPPPPPWSPFCSTLSSPLLPIASSFGASSLPGSLLLLPPS